LIGAESSPERAGFFSQCLPTSSAVALPAEMLRVTPTRIVLVARLAHRMLVVEMLEGVNRFSRRVVVCLDGSHVPVD
jgi:hypothetical protein